MSHTAELQNVIFDILRRCLAKAGSPLVASTQLVESHISISRIIRGVFKEDIAIFLLPSVQSHRCSSCHTNQVTRYWDNFISISVTFTQKAHLTGWKLIYFLFATRTQMGVNFRLCQLRHLILRYLVCDLTSEMELLRSWIEGNGGWPQILSFRTKENFTELRLILASFWETYKNACEC